MFNMKPDPATIFDYYEANFTRVLTCYNDCERCTCRSQYRLPLCYMDVPYFNPTVPKDSESNQDNKKKKKRKWLKLF